MSHPTRDRWSLLTYKAQQHVLALQEQMALAQRQLEHCQAGEQRMRALLIEYEEQHARHSAQSHHVADALNQRQFLSQLTQLLAHAQHKVQTAQAQKKQLEQTLLAAQMELTKSEKLEAHIRANEFIAEQRREQRAIDDLAILRYHWRQV